MDLLATVRKEGARGGRGDFKWSDVQSSTHRENYLGHSLMAPVGRWQKGRDLNWYAKGSGGAEDGEDPAAKAERERKEEIKRIKEAEQDALAKALGFEVTPRNPNMETLGDRKEVDKILKEAAEEEEGGEGGKGVGFGAYGGRIGSKHANSEERIEGTAPFRPPEEDLNRPTKSRRRGGSRERRRRSRSWSRSRSRSRSKDRTRDPDRRQRRHERREHHGKRRSRSRERQRRHHSRSRSRSRERRRDDHYVTEKGEYRRDRSRSPRWREEYRRSYDQYDRQERRR
jgi:hypothetical protein